MLHPGRSRAAPRRSALNANACRSVLQVHRVHVTQPRCGRSEATGPRQAAFLDLMVVLLPKILRIPAILGQFWPEFRGEKPDRRSGKKARLPLQLRQQRGNE